jgi:SOS response regulatory protein OraA/RecX
MRKGISSAEITIFLESIRDVGNGFEEALAKDLAKKARIYSHLDVRVRKMKLKNYLYSKGYASDSIDDAIDTFYKLK